jgi:hypothetical protein
MTTAAGGTTMARDDRWHDDGDGRHDDGWHDEARGSRVTGGTTTAT